MKFNKVIFALLAILGISVSCQKEISEKSEPVSVKRLVSPRNDLSVNFKNLDVLTFEWEATKGKEGAQTSFELVFDKVGGNFSNPVYSVKTYSTQVELTYEEAQNIMNAVADGAEMATVEWAVYVNDGKTKTLSTEKRKLTFDSSIAAPFVKSLYAPANNMAFNLFDLEENVQFRWSAAVWEGTGEVSYEVVFVKDGVQEPVLSLPSQTNTLNVSPEQLSDVFDELSVEGAPVELSWYVNAIGGGKTAGSLTSNVIVLQYIEARRFKVGETLYIGGAGSENGQQFTYVDADYYDTSISTYGDNFAMDMPYYEIHTKLKADSDYYFYGLDGENLLYVSANDFTPVGDEVSAVARVNEDGLYRIRINTTTGEIVAKKISRLYFLHLHMKYEIDFDYAAKGVWSKNFKLEVDENGQWRDDRYKFVVEFADGNIQHYGANHNDDNRHNNPETAPEGYFDIQMTKTSEWDGKFKITSDYHRKYATVTVYLNDDKGHYTHEFSNKTEDAPAIGEFNVGEALYIGGAGAEDGQQFTFVDADYYDTTVSTYGDNFPMEMPYYEIHTKLTAGSYYYFYGLDGTNKVYVSANNFTTVADDASASTTVAEDGLYRIRINTATGEVVAKKISRMYFLHLWMKYKIDFDYVAKGVWSKNFKLEVDENGQWRDDRYKFVVEFADGNIQHYGANHNDDNRHNNPETAPEGYFDIQMTATSEWNGKFKITGEYHRKYATVTVYLNEDKGHYTHEFSNKSDSPQ